MGLAGVCVAGKGGQRSSDAARLFFYRPDPTVGLTMHLMARRTLTLSRPRRSVGAPWT